MFAVGPNPVAVTVGRFNNDGIDDFAVLNQAGGSVQGSVTIYFGVQSGNPGGPITIHNLGSLPWSITAADFDDDDDEDELALTISNGQVIRILLVS